MAPKSACGSRFLYRHPSDWYLSLSEQRDVIETPIESVYDVNGWDLRKALRLALKGNPVLFEWLSSPSASWCRCASSTWSTRSTRRRRCARLELLRTKRMASEAAEAQRLPVLDRWIGQSLEVLEARAPDSVVLADRSLLEQFFRSAVGA